MDAVAPIVLSAAREILPFLRGIDDESSVEVNSLPVGSKERKKLTKNKSSSPEKCLFLTGILG